MVRLMLNDLGRPSAEALPVFLPGTVQVFHLYIFVSGGLSYPGQGKASLLRLVGPALIYNDRIIVNFAKKLH